MMRTRRTADSCRCPARFLDDSATRLRLLAILCACLLLAGCATSSNRWVSLRATPRNPLTETLGLLTKQGPKPTERTIQLLRRYNLEKDLEGDRTAILARLSKIDAQSPQREHAYAQAELAYVGAKQAERAMRKSQALELYGSAVLHSYRYLFDESYGRPSNPYDPEFRRACDLYNAALEDALRIVQDQNELRPGSIQTIKTASKDCHIKVQLQSNYWKPEDFDYFEFVSDYEVHGLRNHYRNYGLGVPLIAVRKSREDKDSSEDFYPEDLSFPVTAFLRVNLEKSDSSPYDSAVLELHDPLNRPMVRVANRTIPLETDLSTPLAHTLSQPALDENRLSTLGLLKPEKATKVQGLYMLEPFQPDKIPVVMVHGLWSSPVTWMEMFNDFRSDPRIHNHYQFWFYLYPTGQPFWFSAAEMRQDMAHMRKVLDPQNKSPALDHIVLVGHSMGGLVSKLQTVESGNEFWNLLSEQPFGELEADPEVRAELAQTFFFDPDPSVRRVITIGTPHRGSEFANDTTRWLSNKLIRIPAKILQGRHQLVSRNPGYFRPNAPLDVHTSIDSLAPDSEVLSVLLTADQGPWVKYHNVIGEMPHKGFTSLFMDNRGDGVVSVDSAKLANATSQLIVPADHVSVHRHPQSILEVRRILLQHLAELRNFPYGGKVEQVTSPQALPQIENVANLPPSRYPSPQTVQPSDGTPSEEESPLLR